ncbi:MAG: sensor histidine kinase [Thermoanaerobaculia bacterium]
MSSDPRPAYETRIALLALAGGLPAVVLGAALLLRSDLPAALRWSLAAAAVTCWLAAAWAVRARLAHSFGTLANLIEALREGDFSIRGRLRGRGGAVNAVVDELNRLADLLKEQRLGALESAALARKVMAEIDLAVFAFDPEERLRVVNPAGERLLAEPEGRLVGRPAEELGLAPLLAVQTDAPVEHAFTGGSGRWSVRQASFREGGMPHRLLVVADLSRTLRREERLAWERLIRVLGHEVNNSLTPIQSTAATLKGLVDTATAGEGRRDMVTGLELIEERARTLSRFISSYARLARLPPPSFESLDVDALVRRVASVENRLPVQVRPGPPARVRGDGTQLEQLLINLVRNAVDAVLTTGGGVEIGWNVDGADIALWICDEGPGIASTANLFVPFFTTKEGGSGIGLALCRQIADAHGATLVLENRTDRRGCVAELRLSSED